MNAQPLLKLDELARIVGGTLHGDPTLAVGRIRPLDDAGEGDLTFFSPSSKNEQSALREKAVRSRATALLVSEKLDSAVAAQIVVPNPMAAVIKLAIGFFDRTPQPPPGIHPTAILSASAEIGTGVRIGAYAVVGENVRIGDRSILHPHVVIYDDAVIGKDCVLHAGAIVRERTELGDDCLIQNGAVLGSDGFGYIPDPELGHRRVPHLGGLVLASRVDVGTNTAIDRATLGESRLGEATKVDNLVQIGHNAKIGKRVILCGQVGIAGSCKIGDDAMLGGAAGISGHLTIGEKARISARAGVSASVRDGTEIAGYPNRPAREWRREAAALTRLPDLLREFRAMRRELNQLKGISSSDSPKEPEE